MEKEKKSDAAKAKQREIDELQAKQIADDVNFTNHSHQEIVIEAYTKCMLQLEE